MNYTPSSKNTTNAAQSPGIQNPRNIDCSKCKDMHHSFVDLPDDGAYRQMGEANNNWSSAALMTFLHLFEHYRLQHRRHCAIDTYFLARGDLELDLIETAEDNRFQKAKTIFTPFHRGGAKAGHYFLLAYQPKNMTCLVIDSASEPIKKYGLYVQKAIKR